ncbi:MAG: pre-peptidase C-terminal domain-containing protein [Melioribacter sp.]|nr:pre-peptidase C-terminal domain-containing protein [Melioribacter sp.]
MKTIIKIITLLACLTIITFAESEPNNSYNTASPLALNSSDNGTLFYTSSQNYDDEDWWVITLPYDGSLYVETNSTGDLEIDLYIYDVNGQTRIAFYDISIGSKESAHHNALKAGTYYVRAIRYNGSGNYTIFNRFVPAPYEVDPEPNDTFENALLLNLNSEATGHIGYYKAGNTDQEDWWKVVIPYNGSLKVRTESDSAEIDLYIYDVDGKSIIARYDISTGLIEEAHFNNLMPGTYYIRVYLYSKHGGYRIINEYKQTSIEGVTLNDYEKNDTYNLAIKLADFNDISSVTNYGHLGFYSNGYTDYEDWWYVDLKKDGKLIVKTLSNVTLELDLYIYDTDGRTQIARYDISTGVNEQTHFNNLGVGRYFIKAHDYSGYGSYKITAEFIPARLANDEELNDDIASAKLINANVVKTGHLGYYSSGITDYNDFYKVILTTVWDSIYVRTDTDSTLELDLYLYDVQGNQISSAWAYGTKEILAYKNSGATEFYIRANSYSGYGSYAIKITNRYPGDPLTGLEEKQNIIPISFALYQNYPNPFNPETNILYEIPISCTVTLKIYDILGNEIKTLVNDFKQPGRYEIKFNGSGLTSGVYFYRLQAKDFVQIKKLLLMK